MDRVSTLSPSTEASSWMSVCIWLGYNLLHKEGFGWSFRLHPHTAHFLKSDLTIKDLLPLLSHCFSFIAALNLFHCRLLRAVYNIRPGRNPPEFLWKWLQLTRGQGNLVLPWTTPPPPPPPRQQLLPHIPTQPRREVSLPRTLSSQ